MFMKRTSLFLLLPLFMIMSSCDLVEDIFENEDECPSVDASEVPEVIRNAFDDQFNTEALLWCEGDANTFYAVFNRNDEELVALFNQGGTLIKEGTDDDFEDGGNIDVGDGIEITPCECELDDDD